ncbi:AAA family ATPase [Exiguobacterium acetylicum]|uniref:AAA family ATPase n=1 Tax=Exiguobacterium acetylicum TaxID=41170 RepID=UPI001EE16133|nr:AAA family ATPase [Exiguobacterium acetylicum]UKS57091.1 AAA family ATPase [Exiguobacterium acetylicum]
MIIWINGTFGVGKTTAATGLQQRWSGSYIFDPEETGYFLRAQLPENKDDFQDEPLWRTFNRQLLEQLNTEDARIIVPMTLTNPEYFQEIIGTLRDSGHDVRHIALMAKEATVKRRLVSRLESPNSWGGKQAKQRLRQLSDPLFSQQIKTDDLTKGQIVDAIALVTGIELSPA